MIQKTLQDMKDHANKIQNYYFQIILLKLSSDQSPIHQVNELKFTINKGRQKFEETDYIKGTSQGQNAIILNNKPKLNFVVLNYSTSKSQQFSLKITERKNSVQKQIGQYTINCNAYVDNFLTTKYGAFQQSIALDNNLKLNIELYIDIKRYLIEKLVKQIHGQKEKKNQPKLYSRLQKIIQKNTFIKKDSINKHETRSNSFKRNISVKQLKEQLEKSRSRSKNRKEIMASPHKLKLIAIEKPKSNTTLITSPLEEKIQQIISVEPSKKTQQPVSIIDKKIQQKPIITIEVQQPVTIDVKESTENPIAEAKIEQTTIKIDIGAQDNPTGQQQSKTIVAQQQKPQTIKPQTIEAEGNAQNEIKQQGQCQYVKVPAYSISQLTQNVYVIQQPIIQHQSIQTVEIIGQCQYVKVPTYNLSQLTQNAYVIQQPIIQHIQANQNAIRPIQIIGQCQYINVPTYGISQLTQNEHVIEQPIIQHPQANQNVDRPIQIIKQPKEIPDKPIQKTDEEIIVLPSIDIQTQNKPNKNQQENKNSNGSAVQLIKNDPIQIKEEILIVQDEQKPIIIVQDDQKPIIIVQDREIINQSEQNRRSQKTIQRAQNIEQIGKPEVKNEQTSQRIVQIPYNIEEISMDEVVNNRKPQEIIQIPYNIREIGTTDGENEQIKTSKTQSNNIEQEMAKRQSDLLKVSQQSPSNIKIAQNSKPQSKIMQFLHDSLQNVSSSVRLVKITTTQSKLIEEKALNLQKVQQVAFSAENAQQNIQKSNVLFKSSHFDIKNKIIIVTIVFLLIIVTYLFISRSTEPKQTLNIKKAKQATKTKPKVAQIPTKNTKTAQKPKKSKK